MYTVYAPISFEAEKGASVLDIMFLTTRSASVLELSSVNKSY